MLRYFEVVHDTYILSLKYHLIFYALLWQSFQKVVLEIIFAALLLSTSFVGVRLE